MLSSLLKFPKKFADPVKKEIGLDFGTKLVNEIADTRLRAFLLNRLKITPGTVTRLIKRYQVKVINSMNRRLHPTMLLKLPQSCTVQLQGFRLPQRSAPLFPSDDIRWDVMKKSCFSNILKETFEANPVNAPIRLLYEDATLLAINKPYNIPFDEPIFIGRIKEKSNCSEGYLRVLNRLEPNETGVLLFAKKETTFNEMSKFFHQAKIDDQVQPVYWAMTTSVYKETPFGEIYSLHYRGRGDHRPRFSK
jgi:23S rRNA-/tRNA-specific pseudouridylate synthase